MDDKAQSIAELLVARGYVQADDLERVALVLSQAQAAPKAESVQSVEDIVEEICLLSTSGYMREQAAKLIAAPLQAGREEADERIGLLKGELEKKSFEVALLQARYAALAGLEE